MNVIEYYERAMKDRTPAFFNFMKAVKSAFGEENFSIPDPRELDGESLMVYYGAASLKEQFSDSSRTLVLPLVLRYKNLVFRNSSHTRPSQDVFVRLSIDINGRISAVRWPAISVMKTTFTHEEARYGFVHGHGGGINQFLPVCLGGGPILQSMHMVNRRSDSKEKQNMSFLVDLKAFIEWENTADRRVLHMLSEDGEVGPLHKIPDMKPVMSMLKEYPFQNAIRVTQDLQVLKTPELEMLLGQILVSLGMEKCTCIRSESGKYLSRKSSDSKAKAARIRSVGLANRATVSINRYVFTFNGEKISNKLSDSNEEKRKNEDFCARPEITKFVCNEIQRKIRRKLASGKKTLRKNPAGDKT